MPHFFYVLISGTFVPTKTISLTGCCVEKKCRGSNPWQETWRYGSDNKKRRWQRRTWGGRLVFGELKCCAIRISSVVLSQELLAIVASLNKIRKCLAARFQTRKLTTVHKVLQIDQSYSVPSGPRGSMWVHRASWWHNSLRSPQFADDVWHSPRPWFKFYTDM